MKLRFTAKFYRHRHSRDINITHRGTTSGSALARGVPGGGHFGMPLISAPSNPVPQFNPSSPYTVTAPGETPVSPASPGSVFH